MQGTRNGELNEGGGGDGDMCPNLIHRVYQTKYYNFYYLLKKRRKQVKYLVGCLNVT